MRGEERSSSALFMLAVHESWADERDWLWLAELVRSPQERRYCLEQALSLNPHSEAALRAVARMRKPTKP